MAADIRRKRIRKAFEPYKNTDSKEAAPERVIGKLPKRTPLHSPKPRTLHPIEKNLQLHGEAIMQALKGSGGFLPLGDHSPPQAIREKFAISKRVFKHAIGHLWKQKKIDIIEGKGIQLRRSAAPSRTPRGRSPQISSPRPPRKRQQRTK